MKLKQQVLLGVALLGSATVIGTASQALNASAATSYRRSKITKVKAKAYYSTSNAKTYRFTGTAKKTKLKANHALKSYRDTTWTRSKQVYVYQKGKKVHYYYVKAARDGATGWVKTSALKAGRNKQATAAKKTKATTLYAVKAGKLYRISGKTSYIKFSNAKKLVLKGKYIKTQQRKVYTNGKASNYYYVKRGKTAGWVSSGYLSTEKPVAASVMGKTISDGTVNGVARYHVKDNAITPYTSTQFSTVKVRHSILYHDSQLWAHQTINHLEHSKRHLKP